MSKQKMTEWFPHSISPVRPGLYETRWPDPIRRAKFPQYQHWNGTFWGAWHMEPEGALASRDGVSARQEPEWRGLAENPNA